MNAGTKVGVSSKNGQLRAATAASSPPSKRGPLCDPVGNCTFEFCSPEALVHAASAVPPSASPGGAPRDPSGDTGLVHGPGSPHAASAASGHLAGGKSRGLAESAAGGPGHNSLAASAATGGASAALPRARFDLAATPHPSSSGEAPSGGSTGVEGQGARLDVWRRLAGTIVDGVDDDQGAKAQGVFGEADEAAQQLTNRPGWLIRGASSPESSEAACAVRGGRSCGSQSGSPTFSPSPSSRSEWGRSGYSSSRCSSDQEDEEPHPHKGGRPGGTERFAAAQRGETKSGRRAEQLPRRPRATDRRPEKRRRPSEVAREEQGRASETEASICSQGDGQRRQGARQVVDGVCVLR